MQSKKSADLKIVMENAAFFLATTYRTVADDVVLLCRFGQICTAAKMHDSPINCMFCSKIDFYRKRIIITFRK